MRRRPGACGRATRDWPEPWFAKWCQSTQIALALQFILRKRPKRVGQGRTQAGEFPRFLLSFCIAIFDRNDHETRTRVCRGRPQRFKNLGRCLQTAAPPASPDDTQIRHRFVRVVKGGALTPPLARNGLRLASPAGFRGCTAAGRWLRRGATGDCQEANEQSAAFPNTTQPQAQ